MPFDYDRDSRHAFAGEARAFAGRERCRDALLGLLRDYCRAKGDAEALEKLLPPRDDAFYFFGGAPRPEKPRRRSRGPAPREAPSLRDRARELWGQLPPESARWFAGLLDATLVRAVGEGAPPARGGPVALADGDGDFFYLFAAAADSHRLNHALVDALDAAAAEDHARLAAGGRGGAADRAAALAARATLCGQVRSLPLYGEEGGAAAPEPPRFAEAAAGLDGRLSDAAFFAATLWCTRLLAAARWDSATRGAPAARATLGRLRAARAVACGASAPSPALLAARLDVEALFRDLGEPLDEPDSDDDGAAAPASPAPASPAERLLAASPRSPRAARGSPRRDDGTGPDADAVAALSARARDLADAFALPPRTAPSPVAAASPLVARRKKLRPQLVAAVPAAAPAPAAPAPPAAAAAPVDAAVAAALRPLAVHFFRRHPALKDAAQLALDAARAHGDGAAEAERRVGQVVALVAPERGRAAEVAANLALGVFAQGGSLV